MPEFGFLWQIGGAQWGARQAGVEMGAEMGAETAPLR